MWKKLCKFVKEQTTEHMEIFKIRTYGKSELAQLYCPYLSSSAARRKLMQWIGMQPALVKELLDSGLAEKAKAFTPIQVKMIVEAIGEP